VTQIPNLNSPNLKSKLVDVPINPSLNIDFSEAFSKDIEAAAISQV
jgi:hypothetical protein